jgi:zinc transport system ATP-binding protein
MTTASSILPAFSATVAARPASVPASSGPPMLRLENVTLDLAGRRILEDVSLTLAPGEFLGLIGPNGGGKTTMLRVVLGLVRPTAGRLAWSNGAEGRQPKVGYVPQRIAVDSNFPLCARELVRQGANGRWPAWGKRRTAVNQRAEELLAVTGLTAHAETPFVHLSGGQQRRLLLARALMNHPSLLLLDEPTAGVDTEGVAAFGAQLRTLARDGLTVLLVSHDIPLVAAHADRLACLARRLHWHGPAAALDEHVIRQAYACELDRYQTRHHPPRQFLSAASRDRTASEKPPRTSVQNRTDLC